ncbi:hypothetical protein HPB48_002382 [Haemaphysalis longicornis]|uniref:Uncharacterized protein n=1 Tax=Haemaphysalis longicornis TaxID=44386 RepID=A0A9J6GZL7_HAELO|nr:hypothetical protein HPB48_002382 [Haemaphysalis longicornis]
MRARAAQQAGSQVVMTSREEADGPPLRGREKQRTPQRVTETLSKGTKALMRHSARRARYVHIRKNSPSPAVWSLCPNRAAALSHEGGFTVVRGGVYSGTSRRLLVPVSVALGRDFSRNVIAPR